MWFWAQPKRLSHQRNPEFMRMSSIFVTRKGYIKAINQHVISFPILMEIVLICVIKNGVRPKSLCVGRRENVAWQTRVTFGLCSEVVSLSRGTAGKFCKQNMCLVLGHPKNSREIQCEQYGQPSTVHNDSSTITPRGLMALPQYQVKVTNVSELKSDTDL